MAALTITKENFDSEVLKSSEKVLVDFWASWCGPCRMVLPVVEEIALEAVGFKVGKVNVDEQPELAAQFGVMTIPTLMVFEKGKIINKTIGAQSKENILALLK
ncbi:MAG: thioredoxin [Eubacteriales bacterium]